MMKRVHCTLYIVYMYAFFPPVFFLKRLISSTCMYNGHCTLYSACTYYVRMYEERRQMYKYGKKMSIAHPSIHPSESFDHVFLPLFISLRSLPFISFILYGFKWYDEPSSDSAPISVPVPLSISLSVFVYLYLPLPE